MRMVLLVFLLFSSTILLAMEAELPQEASNNKKVGQEIYEQHCSVCHQDGIAGAPKFRNSKDWTARLKNQSDVELITKVMKGFNAMPAKGTCQDCSETQLKAAIDYMVPK